MTPIVDQREPMPMPFVEFVAHLRARRAGAARLFGAILAVALGIAAIVPPRFDAVATLAVLPAPEFTVRQDAGSRTLSTSALAMDQIMKAETEILKSPDLHADTLHALGLLHVYPALDRAAAAWPLRAARATLRVLLLPWRAPVPDSPAARLEAGLRRFDADLSVLPAKDANVITVTFGHRDGAVSAAIVNNLLAGYAKRREQIYNDPQLAVVRRETDNLGGAVRKADTAIAAFKAGHAIADFGTERDLLVRRQSQAAQALADATADAAEHRARARAVDREIATMPKTVNLYQEADTDVRLQTIDASLVELRSRVATARLNYRDSSRKVTDLMSLLATRQAERSRLANDPSPSMARNGRSPTLDSLLLDRARARTEQAAAAARVAELKSQAADLAAHLADFASEEASLDELMRRKAVADAAFADASQVLAGQRMTEAEDALRLANVRVIQLARVPLRPAPIPLLIVLSGALFGALAALLYCVGGLLIRPSLLTEEGLAQATGLPVLAVFPARADDQRIYMPG